MSLTEKIIANHLSFGNINERKDIGIKVDQAYLEDHSGVQGMLFFEAMKKKRVIIDKAVCYVDHNLLPHKSDMEGHLYLQSACAKYGVWYSKAGSGICHLLHMDNFAKPGTVILGANSHTAQCGGACCLAFGVGSIDVASAFAGRPYNLSKFEVVNIILKNKLHDWCSAKDIALKLLQIYSASGFRGKILEFTGEGIKTLSIEQRSVLTHMSVEMGAKTGIFPSDEVTHEYFKHLHREKDWIELLPDEDAKYSQTIELDLSEIEPLVALPSQPDNVVLARSLANVPVNQVIIGSCTSGSYEDLSLVSYLFKNQLVHPNVGCIIQPNSRKVIYSLCRKKLFNNFILACAEVTPPSCDSCVGIGCVPAPGVNSLRAFSRNFAGRSGCENDAVYLCSAQTAAVSAITGVITDPRDFAEQANISYPNISMEQDLDVDDNSFHNGLIEAVSQEDSEKLEIKRAKYMNLDWMNGSLPEHIETSVVMKAGDSISTDYIIPNGLDIKANRADVQELSKYLFYRYHREFYNDMQKEKSGWIVAGENFGKGSARENAVILLKSVGIRGILALSLADTYLNNMVNFGMLPLVFERKEDYTEIQKDDILQVTDLNQAIYDDIIILNNITGKKQYRMRNILSENQRTIVKYGGVLEWERKKNCGKQ